MLPIFKSHYSIGKSILTLDDKKDCQDDGADSIFQIIKELGHSELILVEDCLTGFLEALNGCKKNNIKLVFGLIVSICNNSKIDERTQSMHKAIIFPKNSSGCKMLNKLSTISNTKNGGVLDWNILNKLWSDNDLKMAIPFYDSFIFNNNFKYFNCIPDFSKISPTFLIEDNDLPFDHLIKKNVLSFCKSNGFETICSKSIFYKNRSDFDAYLTYKCICNRKSFSSTLDKPNFDHLGSREFCVESWKEKNK